MIEHGANIHLFYPMLFITVGIILVVFICSVKAILIKFKDKDSQNFIFQTHVQEHTDTTSKMADMHKQVVFTEAHEHELDTLENGLKRLVNV